jgi:hypothetical protein
MKCIMLGLKGCLPLSHYQSIVYFWTIRSLKRLVAQI